MGSLQGMKADQPNYDDAVHELQHALEHHMKEEEEEFLAPMCEKETKEDLLEMATQFEQVKKETGNHAYPGRLVDVVYAQ